MHFTVGILDPGNPFGFQTILLRIGPHKLHRTLHITQLGSPTVSRGKAVVNRKHIEALIESRPENLSFLSHQIRKDPSLEKPAVELLERKVTVTTMCCKTPPHNEDQCVAIF